MLCGVTESAVHETARSSTIAAESVIVKTAIAGEQREERESVEDEKECVCVCVCVCACACVY